jgi:hypothetical protein
MISVPLSGGRAVTVGFVEGRWAPKWAETDPVAANWLWRSVRAGMTLVGQHYGLTCSGFAYCHPRDTFDLHEGQRKALTRALNDGTARHYLSKDDRAAIWWAVLTEQGAGVREPRPSRKTQEVAATCAEPAGPKIRSEGVRRAIFRVASHLLAEAISCPAKIVGADWDIDRQCPRLVVEAPDLPVTACGEPLPTLNPVVEVRGGKLCNWAWGLK